MNNVENSEHLYNNGSIAERVAYCCQPRCKLHSLYKTIHDVNGYAECIYVGYLTYIAKNSSSILSFTWDHKETHINIEHNGTNSNEVIQIGTTESNQSSQYT